MRIIMKIVLPTLISSSLLLSGCHGMRGNVVPQTGPTMEQVYDDKTDESATSKTKDTSVNPVPKKSPEQSEEPMPEVRRKLSSATTSTQTTRSGFNKIPNPELTLYVFPHLAGASEIPIPGYSTAFNAYDRDHYMLPQDTMRN